MILGCRAAQKNSMLTTSPTLRVYTENSLNTSQTNERHRHCGSIGNSCGVQSSAAPAAQLTGGEIVVVVIVASVLARVRELQEHVAPPPELRGLQTGVVGALRCGVSST